MVQGGGKLPLQPGPAVADEGLGGRPAPSLDLRRRQAQPLQPAAGNRPAAQVARQHASTKALARSGREPRCRWM